MNIEWVGAAASSFHGGREGHQIQGVVIHVEDGTEQGTDAWFHNPISHVSAHYGIDKLGNIQQFVKEEDSAFHCGIVDEPTWVPATTGFNPNFITIGIEHEGRATDEWTDQQYNSSSWLIADICKRHGLPIDRNHIIGHHEIRASKTCPGKGDVDRLVSMAQQATKSL